MITNDNGNGKDEYLEIEKKVDEKRKLVDIFLDELSENDRKNYHFIADIFSPEDHFLHIQESYGFKQWLSNKKKN